MENQEFYSRTNLSDVNEAIDKVKAEIKKIIVGQDLTVDLLLTAILADGHVLIEGVPGIAKTLMAKLIAKTIDADFSRIQFTPDLMPSDILGTSVFNMKTSGFEFIKGPIFSNFILIDEINRSPAKTQAALFEVMEERQITIDGHRFEMEEPFFVVATQNPVEHEGTYKLPEAQLDRFLFKIEMGYPSPEDELKVIMESHERKSYNDLSVISKVISPVLLKKMRDKVRSVRIDENVASYIANIINKTRNNGDIFLGASPRASIAVLLGAKAFAASRGRDFVTPDDIKSVIRPALRHRIILSPEKEMEGVTPDEIIELITSRTEVPR